MSKNPLAAKVAAPYARALYDFSVEQNLMHQVTADFQNLEVFLAQTPDLTDYFMFASSIKMTFCNVVISLNLA